MPLTPTAAIRISANRAGGTNSQLYIDSWILRKFQETLDVNTQLAKIPRTDALPTGEGADTVRWVLFSRLAEATALLTPGTDPTNSTAITTAQVTATIGQYGAYIETTDLFPLTVVSGSMAAMIERLGIQATDTVDILIRNKAYESTNTTQDNATIVTTDLLDGAMLRTVSSKFQAANVKPHPATDGGRFYFYWTHPNASFDLQGDIAAGGWSEGVKYVATGMPSALEQDGGMTNGAGNIWMGSPGIFAGCQVAVSTNCSTTTEDVEVYQSLAFGKEGIAHVALNSNIMKPEIIIRKPGPTTLSSPLGMRMTWGWKINYVVELIDETQVQLVYNATGNP